MTWEKLNSVRMLVAVKKRGEVSRTIMVQVLAKFHVAVSSGGDVEIALNLVEVEGAVDATAVSSAPEARGLAPFSALLAEGDNVMDVLLSKALVVVGETRPALAGIDAAVGIVA